MTAVGGGQLGGLGFGCGDESLLGDSDLPQTAAGGGGGGGGPLGGLGTGVLIVGTFGVRAPIGTSCIGAGTAALRAPTGKRSRLGALEFGGKSGLGSCESMAAADTSADGKSGLGSLHPRWSLPSPQTLLLSQF